MSSILW